MDDFSDLFTLPEHPSKPTKSAQKASTLPPVVVNATNGSKKCAEPSFATPLTPASPTPPSTPRLQFPIPPSNFGLTSMASEKSSSRYSQGSSKTEPTTPSSKHSNSSLKLPATSPQHRFSISRERRSDRIGTAGVPSEDESDRARAFSLSGSDTDASRATDSSVRSRRGRHHSALPKASAMKRPAPLQRAPSSSEKLSSGPPPSAPLPSPPLSARFAPRLPISSLPVTPTDSVPHNSTVHSPGIAPRPRANTVSAATSLSSARLAAWMAPRPSPQNKQAPADPQLLASEDDLRNALALQNRKYAQLQEYAVTITKKFEDEKASMSKTIQMLEREIRKKVREIEGLRWLVIHNGGADDIDAAESLARASLITLDDGNASDAAWVMDSTRGEAPSQSARPSTTKVSVGSRRGLGLDYLDQSSPSGASLEPSFPELGIVASASSSHSSLCLPMLASSTTSSLSAIPEQQGETSRVERQQTKEERRASRALRRISSSSMSSVTSGALMAHPLPIDHTLDPQSSMENVLEKLRPFRNT